jgi:tetratricopeptide (TPR) repeat protein
VQALLRRRAAKRTVAAIAGLAMAAALGLSGTCLTTDACAAFFPATHSDRSIAVLAFENQLRDERLAAITDVFVDELREALAGVKEQPVAARAATRALPENLTPGEIGERLRVRWLVAGSISGSQNQIELLVEIIDTDSGYLESAKRYAALVSDLEDVRLNIANDLLGVIGGEELIPDLEPRSEGSSEAYLLYLSGKASLKQRKTDEAESYFRKAQALEPGYPEAEAGLCRVSLTRFESGRDSRDFATAESHCSQALMAPRRISDAGLALGQLYLLEGNVKDAERSFRQALALNNSSADALIGLARVSEERGQSEEAERLLREGVIAQRGYWRTYNELGIFLLGQGRIDEALAAFDDALAFAPDDSVLLNNLAVTYALAEQFERAIAAWTRVIDFEQDAAAYGNLGTAYYWSGDMDTAVSMYREAVRLHPEDFRWWSSLGDAQMHLPSADARPAFERALAKTVDELSVNPDNVDVHIGRAPILAALGRAEEARAILDDHRQPISENPQLTYLAAVTAVRLDDHQSAREYLAATRQLGYPEVFIRADPTFAEILAAETSSE